MRGHERVSTGRSQQSCYGRCVRRFLLVAGIAAGLLIPTSHRIADAVSARTQNKHVVSIVLEARCALALDATQQLRAIATYDDASTADVTDSATWRTSDRKVMTVRNAKPKRGLLIPVGPGSATVSASIGTTSGHAAITVVSSAAPSIEVTPINPSIAAGRHQQLTATARYSASCTEDVTAGVTWSSSNSSVAVVSNALGSRGLATGLGLGTSEISAQLGGVLGSTTLTVTPAVLLSIDLIPANPTVSVAGVRQLTAVGTYSDGTVADVTASASWSSNNPNAGTVSNAPGSQGVVTGVSVGSTEITAVYAGVIGTTTVTVTDS